LTKTRENDIIWCEPKTAPFNQLPLVAVRPSKPLLLSHFKNEYIQEQLAQSIDNLNLTYVAITRPKYRLYIYGQINRKTSNTVGAEIFALYKKQLNAQLIYRVPNVDTPAPLPPPDEEECKTLAATYVQEPINSRLTLRSRAEDDFAAGTPLAAVDLGILMHLWLSYINTWQDAEPTLLRLIRQGQVTEQQAIELRQQFNALQSLIERENHADWFSNQYKVLSEQDILTTSGNMQRPDRVMISGTHAIVIDYKFGHEQTPSHQEQVRDYMLLLRQMGYTTEGHIIYVAHNKIYTIQ
jgi:ATP-dependent exoDNAse (exonuclease V) beta subunit